MQMLFHRHPLVAASYFPKYSGVSPGPCPGRGAAPLGVVLVLALIGGLPSWGYSSSWGYGPSGGIGFLLLIIILIFLFRGGF